MEYLERYGIILLLVIIVIGIAYGFASWFSIPSERRKLIKGNLIVRSYIGLSLLLLVSYPVLKVIMLVDRQYTIGVTEKVVYRRNSAGVQYSLCVNGSMYYGDAEIGSVKHPHHRYLVKYIPWFPYMNEMLSTYEITDSTISEPVIGWDEIPLGLK
ncbi:hypothetical protein SAMN05444266_10139 [Chitinophaga jiangningensis]|uniref:Uncharacterized protein n=1 Tax=Chitinophaga jiangningensis TaxID=1419482 RepID=A0A1M6V2N4_9BACT|nr:hypothetical protein [Chitinophaga jiangningensis]SHK75641.1 hypothetical protein SAMN05444266_10139 [Chitinophaga jiangningensis]